MEAVRIHSGSWKVMYRNNNSQDGWNLSHVNLKWVMVHVRVGVCENVEPTGSGTTSDNGKEGGGGGGAGHYRSYSKIQCNFFEV